MTQKTTATPGFQSFNIPGLNMQMGKDGTTQIIVGGQKYTVGGNSAKGSRTTHFKPAYSKKIVDNQFNFNNSRIDNCAIGNKGPVNFKNKHEVFEKGAQKTSYDISGGNFNQPNFGGDVSYKNEKSTLSASEVAGKKGGVPSSRGDVPTSRGDWSIDVNATILLILNKVPTQTLLNALRQGKKLTEIAKVVEKMDDGMDVDVVFDSFLKLSEADMET